jgi:hypothetical protein
MFRRLALAALLLSAGCRPPEPPAPATSTAPPQGELLDAPAAVPAPAPSPSPAPSPVALLPEPLPPEIPPTPETVEEPPPPAPPAEKSAVKAADGPEYLPLTLAELGAFKYDPPVPPLKGAAPPPPRPDPYPAHIKELDGRKVDLTGFMYPLRMEKGKIAEFLLMPTILSCCFADRVKMNEFVAILPADGKPVRFWTQVHVRGILEVGEEKDEDGWVLSCYRLKADLIEEARPK